MEIPFYISVFDWPTDHTLVIPELKNQIDKAELLATGKKLKVKNDGGRWLIEVPEKELNSAATVGSHGKGDRCKIRQGGNES